MPLWTPTPDPSPQGGGEQRRLDPLRASHDWSIDDVANTPSPHASALPLPPAGEGWGEGDARMASRCGPPPPTPPRRGEGSRLGFGESSRQMTDLLRLEGVHTNIGRYHILQGVDCVVPEGQTTMLLGRNGAGKTTTLRTIMGLWPASRGTITLGGRRIEAMATPDIARLGVGYVPETMAVFSDLTVKENLILAARDGEMDAGRLDWIFGFFPALRKFWLSRAGSLSGGQKQMLSIARAVIEPRQLLLIDEPTKGLAPAIIGALIDCFAEIKRSGATILLVEQNFHVAQQIGDSVLVMDNGMIVHRGAMAELAADVPLQERLLGLSLEAHQ
uniref:Possible branched-chain amino acid transport system ATP-binding protein n=2 Tax=Rhodopseudomonas palustris (strain ATCC BAA-98 / CGA009) TaxID=258594 RepID=Q6N1K6_RHOPA|nr:possible branched-chain amino acid transport system ATP-binding protein [Rhodopseudomonas palustris CGA009]